METKLMGDEGRALQQAHGIIEKYLRGDWTFDAGNLANLIVDARAEGEAAGRAQGHEEAAEAIDGELCPRCDTDIALSTWARVFREKAAAIRARKEG